MGAGLRCSGYGLHADATFSLNRVHHVVFTLPHDLSWLAPQNKTIVYDLLFHANAATLLEVAADRTHLSAAWAF